MSHSSRWATPDGGPSRESSARRSPSNRGVKHTIPPQRALPGDPHFLNGLFNHQTLTLAAEPAAPLPRLEGSRDGSSEPAGSQPGHGSRRSADSPDITSEPGCAPSWGPSLGPGGPHRPGSQDYSRPRPSAACALLWILASLAPVPLRLRRGPAWRAGSRFLAGIQTTAQAPSCSKGKMLLG